MDYSLDLARRNFVRTQAGLMFIGTWFKRSDGRWRPCMVIIREGDEYSDHAIPCIVSVDSAWIWSEEVGDPAQAARQAFSFAEALRLDTANFMTVPRLAGQIADHLGDLLTIPPRPPGEKEVIGVMTVTDNETGRTMEREILVDV